MIRKIDHGPWVDGAQFNENRNQVPAAELLKLAGEWVAFSVDGTRIVAHHPDMLALAELVKAAGLDQSEVVYEAMPEDFDAAELG